MTRVLLTGSRDWTDRDVVNALLNQAFPGSGILVHGACPTGADALATEWANAQPDILIERHPAQWDVYGRRAGHVRNSHMVGLGADQCLAFIKDESRGASMTADLAERAGIPTRRIRAGRSDGEFIDSLAAEAKKGWITISPRRTGDLQAVEAERDALRETVKRVSALADKWLAPGLLPTCDFGRSLRRSLDEEPRLRDDLNRHGNTP